MSNRRNRRSIWSTLARRRRAAVEALRFLPNRTPVLSRLFAGTALGCSFLAFAAPGAAKAQSIDNTNLTPNSGYIGTTTGANFRTFGYGFQATQAQLENLTVFTAQYNNSLTSFHISLFQVTNGDLSYGFSPGTTPLYSTTSHAVTTPYTVPSFAAFETQTFDNLNWNLTIGANYVAVVVPESAPGMRMLGVQDTSMTTPGTLIYAASPADSNYYDYQYLPMDTVFWNSNSTIEIAFRMNSVADYSDTCGMSFTSGADTCVITAATSVTDVSDALGGFDVIDLSTVSGDVTFDGDGIGSDFVNFEQITASGAGQVTLTGSISEIAVQSSGADIVVDGSVTSSGPGSSGVFSGASGGDVTISATGSVTSQNAVVNANGGTVTNHGQLYGDATYGGGVGISLSSGGTVVNTGTIATTPGAYGYGVMAQGGSVSVDNSGTISGATDGILANVTGGQTATVTNSGTVTGQAYHGVGIYTQAGGGGFTQTAGYVSGNWHGVYVYTTNGGAASVDISGGEVHGGRDAVRATTDGGDITFNLGGTLTSGTGATARAEITGGSGNIDITVENGARLSPGNTVAVDAINRGTGTTSVQVDNGANVYGAINVTTFGTANVTVDGSVLNVFGPGMDLTNSHDAQVTIGATGSVESLFGFGIVGTAGADHIYVAGSVHGGSIAIEAGPGGDTVTLYSTAQFYGDVSGGADTDTLALAGSGTGAVNLSNFVGFELGHVTGGTWTLSGYSADILAWTIDNGATLVATADNINANVVDNGTLQLSGAHDFGFDVSGVGVVQASGGGTVAISGDVSTSLGLFADNTNLALSGDVTAAGNTGVTLTGTGATSVDLDVTGTSAISGIGNGVTATAASGDVSVSGDAGTSISAGNVGIYASTGGAGAATVYWQGSIDSFYHGVFAQTSGSGDVSVTVGDVSGHWGEGVYARATGTGDITIHTLGTVTETGDSGIRAVGHADVSVTTEGTVTAYNYGVTAFSYSGNVTVTTNGSVTGQHGAGISAGGGGATVLNVNNDVSGARSGVFAGGSSLDINIAAGADVSGSLYDGVQASSFLGSIDIDIAAGATVSGNRYGVYANNFYSGLISVTADGGVSGAAGGIRVRSNNANLEVFGAGDISSQNGNGIDANTGSNGTVTIVNTGTIDAGGVGVFAGTVNGGIGIDVADVTSAGIGVDALTGQGAIDIDVGDVTSNGDIAILAQITDVAATSDITIGVTGMVQGYNGIVASNAGSGNIVIDVEGTVIGTAFAGGAHGIVLSGGSSDVTIGYTGIVSSNSQVGLVGTSGSDVVRIQGTLAGFNGAADLGSGDDTVYLYAGAHVYGAFSAGTGYDRLFLTGSGDATFDFDSGQFSGFDYGRIIGTGHWTLVGTDNIGFSMSWNVGPGGTLDGDTNTFTGDITDDGTVAFDQNFDGTFAYDITGTGNVEVSGGGTVTFTGDLDIDGGIDILDSSGVQVDGSLTTTGDGVFADVAGDVNIGVGGSINSGGDGVDATSTGGRVIVTTDGGSSIVAGGDGIVARSDIGISIYNHGTIDADPGMNLTATGNADIYVNSTNDITADNGGIVTSAEAGPTDIRVSATVEGDDDNNGGGDGIHSTSTTGSISIHTYAGGDIVGDNANGVFASSNSGAITLTIEGDVGTAGLPVDSVGVLVSDNGGAVNVTVSGDVYAAGTGVSASNNGAGTVHVTQQAGSLIGGAAGTGIFAGGSNGLVEVDADGAIGSAADRINTIGVFANTGGTGNIDVSVTGSIYSSSQGVLTVTNGADADTQVTVGGHIDAPFGITARSYGAGDSDVSIDVTGQITGSSNAVYGAVRNGASTGTVDIDVTGSIQAAGNAIWGRNLGSGGVTITTGVASDIAGTAGNGVIAQANSGVVTVTTAGTIGSAADEVAGNGVDARNYGAGSVTVTNSGDVYADTFGVYGRATTSAGISITNSADVTAGRTGLRGIGSTGAVTVTNQATGTVTVDGTNPNTSSMGVYAFTNNSVGVFNDGDITVTSNDTNIVAGVRIVANNGFATAYSAGDINVTANNPASAHGIVIADSDLGAHVVVDGDINLTTNGQNFGAIVVTSGGAVEVDAAYFNVSGSANGAGIQVNSPGAVTVNLTEGHVSGVNAEAVVIYGSLGTVQVDVGEASTNGADSQGILVGGGATGAVTVTADSVTTNGAGSHGIQVTTIGHIDITATDVTTQSGGAAGILADGDFMGMEITTVAGGLLNTSGRGIDATTVGSNGTIDINVHGDITAGGIAINATSGTGLVDIVAQGDITGASGIVASTGGAGNVNLYASGNVTGVTGPGLSAQTDSGAIDITFAGIGATIQAANNDGVVATTATGTIQVTGQAGDVSSGFTGIYAHVTGSNGALAGDAIDIDWAGDVAAYGSGVLARTVDGDIDIDINTAHTGLAGVYATSTSGDVSITATGAIYSDGRADGVHGIHVVTGGDVYVSSADIQTGLGGARQGLEGIRAQGYGVEIRSGSIDTNATLFGNGINVIAGAGGATVQSGSVETTGSYSRAIVIATAGAIDVDSTYAHTTGFGSAAVDIYGGAGDIQIVSDTIVTDGNSSAGIVTRGSGYVYVDAGSVTTHGANAVGISVQGEGGGGSAGSAVVHADSVTTTGAYSLGVGVSTTGMAALYLGDVTTSIGDGVIVNAGEAYVGVTGAINVGGYRGDGVVISASSTEMNLTGSVTASGYDANGVAITGGAIHLFGGGDVTTHGDGAGAVYLVSTGDIDVTLGAITTTGGNSANYGSSYGLFASTTGAITADIGSVSTAGDSSRGVRLYADGTIDLTIGAVTTTGQNADGLWIVGNDQDVSVTTTGAVSVTGPSAVGVRAAADQGDVQITVGGAVNSAGSVGVLGLSNSGGVSVTANADVSGGTVGIQTSAVGGGYTQIIVGAGVDVSGGANDGVHADATTGDVYVYVGVGASLSSASGDGLEVAAQGGDIRVVSYGAITGDPGVVLSNTGSGSIDFDSFAPVTGDQGGIVATAEAGTITLNVYGTVEGDDDNSGAGDAIQASVTTGAITIHTSATGDIVGDNGNGIVALVTGAGATGDIAIVADGDVGSAGTMADGTGVYAVSLNGGSADVSITGAGNIYGGFTGVIGRVSGTDSDIYLNLSGNVTGGYNGIVTGAFGAGDTDITMIVGGVVNSNNNGVEGQITNAASTGTLTTQVLGDIYGLRGVSLVNNGSGGLYVGASLGSLIDVTSNGVGAQSGGESDIHAAFYGDIVAGGRGVILNVAGSGAGDITVGSYGSVTADDSGLFLNTGSGSISATVGGVVTGNADLVGAGNGVTAQTTTGQIDIVTLAGSEIGGDTTIGIRAVASGDNTTHVAVQLDGDAGSAGNHLDGSGVQALITSSSATGAVSVTGAGDVWADGVGVYGFNAGTGGVTLDLDGDVYGRQVGVFGNVIGASGDVTITTDGAISANYVGISGYQSSNPTATGDVAITANAAITSNGTGVYAFNYGTGDIRITTGAAGDIAGTAYTGVAARSYGGAVTIVTQGDIGSVGDAVGGRGIRVRSGVGPATGDVDVHTYGDVFANGNGVDVYVQAPDMGVTVVTDGDVTSDGFAAIQAVAAAGGASPVVVTTNGDVNGGYHGIYARILNTNTGDITVTVNGAVSGAATAISAYNAGSGDTVVTLAATATLSGVSGTGISTYGTSGDVTIHQLAAIGSGADPVTTDGILARMGAAGTLTVDGQGAIFAGDDGVDARGSGGDILITLNAAADIRAADDGISVTNGGPAFPSIAYGDITIVTDGTITAASDGIDARITAGSNAGHISITANDAIGGSLVGSGIYARAMGGGVDVTTGVNGDIAGTANTGINAVANGGGVTIHNNGDVGTAGDSVGGVGVRAVQLSSSSTVTVDGSGRIFAGGIGILAQTGGANSDVNVNLTSSNADIVAGSDGIQVTATGTGDSDLTVFANGTIQAGNNGVDVTVGNAANTGTITVTTNDTINATGRGIRTQNNGTGGVTVTANAAITAGATGIAATATTGPVNLYANADITAGTGDAIFAQSTDGDVYVSTLAGRTLRSTAGDGIEVQTTGAGDIHVESRAAIDADPGIILNAAGSGNILLNSLGVVTADAGGIVLTANSGDVDLTVSNTVEGDDDNNGTGNGVYARSVTGTVTVVTTAAGDIVGDNASGIVARTTGASNGGVSLTLAGDIGTAATPVDGYGVFAGMASGGTGAITVDLSGDIHAGGTGIYARNDSSGGVTITTGAGADVSAGGLGVYARSTMAEGDVTVTTHGSVTAAGAGVQAAAFGGGDTDVTIVNTATITAGGDGVSAFSGGGTGSISINSSGLVDAQGVGIIATGLGSGGIVVTQSGGITGAASLGIQANSVLGSTIVHNNADIGSAGDAVTGYGVTVSGYTYARVDGTGAIFAGGVGVDASSGGPGGDIVIDLAATADIVAGGRGIVAVTADGDITVDMDGTVTSQDYGVLAVIQPGGTGSIIIGMNDVIDTTGVGIFASNVGSGDVSITTSAAADITGAADVGISAFGYGTIGIHNAGDIGSAADAVTGDGIYVQGVGAGDITLDGAGLIFAGDDGIEAHSFGGGDILVNLPASADIVAGDRGVYAYGWGAGLDTDISITTANTVTAGARGIDARIATASNTGTITVTANDAIDGALSQYGVLASNAGSGGVTVTTGAAGDISGNAANGIVITAAGGNVTVHNNGDVGSAGNAVTSTGVYALLSVGAGTITVDGSGAIFAGGNGLWTNASGAGADTVISLTSPSADIVAGGSGIVAQASNTGDNDITVTMNGSITAGGNGIYARNTGAANTGSIVITANDALNVQGWGVVARTAGSGDVQVTTGANGDVAGTGFGGVYAEAGGAITVSNAGDLGASGDFLSNDGVRAIGAGSGTILINGSGAIFAGDDGIDARALGAGGDITVTLPGSATIRSVDDGVYALASGAGDSDINLTFSGAIVSSGGNGIDARITNALNTGTLIVNANASVTASGGAAIRAENQGSGGTTINIAAASVITGQAGFAIDTEGNGSTINNAGTVNGFVDLSAGADAFNNTGLWNALGTSAFGGGTDTVNNTARVEVAPAQPTATTVLWTGLESFNNNGGVVDLRQGHTGDVFTLQGTAFTGTTVGLNSSRLQIDVSLMSPLTSDRLNIGAAAGSTLVQVVDLAAAQNGALDLTGVVVVDATSGPASAFTLDGGPIQKGFVSYDLVFDGANFDWRLLGLPSAEAFQMVKLGASAQDFWSHSADAWSNRMGEVRDAQAAGDPTRSEGWEMWGQALVGGRETTSHPTYTLGLATLTPNLSTDSSWRGFQSGADNLQGDVLYGVMGGFQQQDTDFEDGRNGFDIEGWNLGGYAGWSSGPFFMNGLLKADWYTVDVNMRSVPAMTHLDGMTWGAKGEVGGRFGGAGLWFEPKADLAWSNTQLDNASFSSLGTAFKYDDVQSLQGSAGFRVGGTWGTIAPYVGVWAVKEFEGENGVTMLTGPGCPSCVTLKDQPTGSFGKVEYGFTVLNWNGLEGFVKGETRFNGDAEGTDLNLGVRWRW